MAGENPNTDGTDTDPDVDDNTGGNGSGSSTPDWASEANKWKALARKHERDAKANADAATKWAESQEAGKTEVERATARAAAAERERDDAIARANRATVAAAKGLSMTVANRLVGATIEELEADADTLLAELGVARADDAGDGNNRPPSGRPQPRLIPGGGRDPEQDVEETDPRKLASRIPRR